MEKFRIDKKIGDGTYGSVLKAVNLSTGEEVAIKQMKKKFSSWDECINLREVKCLRKLNHPNLIKLKEVVKLHDELNLIFEYFDQNIYQYYMSFRDKQQHIPEPTIKQMIFQIVSGLGYMHKHGFFHRDLKPENILHHNGIVKIIDFGLAREIRSRPPYTDYVSTRWYRAPELLLRSTTYNSPVDIFAVGCIMAELYNLSPLFSGSNELDQLNKIMKVLGSPTQAQWPEGHKLASRIGVQFPGFEKQAIEKIVPKASKEAVDLLNWIFTYESTKRPTAQQILNHPYFTGVVDPTNNNLLMNTSNHGGFGAASPQKALKNFTGGEQFPEIKLRSSNAFKKQNEESSSPKLAPQKKDFPTKESYKEKPYQDPFKDYGGSLLGGGQKDYYAQKDNFDSLYGGGGNKIPSLLPPKPQNNYQQQYGGGGGGNNLPSYIPQNSNFPSEKAIPKLPTLYNKNVMGGGPNSVENLYYNKPPLQPANNNNNGTYNFGSFQGSQNYQPQGNQFFSQSQNNNQYKPLRENNNNSNLQFAARNNILNNINIGNPYHHESTSMPPLGQRNQKGATIQQSDKFSYNKYMF